MTASFARPLSAAAALSLMLAACSPVFNWREVPVGEAGLVALLPCKPDRAARSVALGTASVEVRMAGCEAGRATFAVAQVLAADRVQADLWLAAWRAQARQAWPGASDDAVAAVPRADASPPPRRFSGHANDARIEVLWFSQAQAGGGVAVYQATVLGQASEPAAATTFFEGLQLP